MLDNVKKESEKMIKLYEKCLNYDYCLFCRADDASDCVCDEKNANKIIKNLQMLSNVS